VLELDAPKLSTPGNFYVDPNLSNFYVDPNLSKLKSFKHFNIDNSGHPDEQYLKYRMFSHFLKSVQRMQNNTEGGTELLVTPPH